MRARVGSREVEVKIAMPSARAARRLLRTHGFRVRRPRVFQDDLVLDDRRRSLERAGCLLRLRKSGAKAWLTYKGPARAGPHKDREEIEVALPPGAFAEAQGILERLGFHPVFRYQKYRAEYARPREPGVVAVDETPIGVYLELEGPAGWIERTARRLGLDRSRYIAATYAELYLQHCRRRGAKPGDMVFPGPR
ncbi:MAG: class IV adenylate cyclase [Bryobacterales bacterium]|nr:class IV adenylate cyclase [Bryobacteraceae bacterium]MDW8128930.1 class IV adenylate cyclase [Bryobacterales bacterium]